MKKPTETPAKPVKKLGDMAETHQAYALLKNEGLTNKETCKALKLNENYGYQIQMKTKGLIKEDSKLVSLARRNLKKLASGKSYGEIKQVKDSTSLAAVNAILDRADPIVRHIETKTLTFNVNYDVADLK